MASALSRLVRKGAIRRLSHGLYDLPRNHPALGQILPAVEDVVRAIQESEAITVQPTGAYAANLLGLSTQVPMRIELYTDGPRKVIRYGRQQIILKPTTPRNMAASGNKAGLIIQALRHLGRENVDEEILARIADGLDDRDRKLLLKHRMHAPTWIARILSLLSEKPVRDAAIH